MFLDCGLFAALKARFSDLETMICTLQTKSVALLASQLPLAGVVQLKVALTSSQQFPSS